MTKSEQIRELLKKGKSIKEIQQELKMKDSALIYQVKNYQVKNKMKSSAPSGSATSIISKPEGDNDKKPTIFKVENEPKKETSSTIDTGEVKLSEEGKQNKEQLEKKFKIKFEYVSSAGPMAMNSAFKEFGLTPLTTEERQNQIEATNDALEYYLNIYSKYAIWINLGFAYGMPFISRIPEIVSLRAQQKRQPSNTSQKTEAPVRTVLGARIDERGHLLENPLLMKDGKNELLKQFKVDMEKKENGNG